MPTPHSPASVLLRARTEEEDAGRRADDARRGEDGVLHADERALELPRHARRGPARRGSIDHQRSGSGRAAPRVGEGLEKRRLAEYICDTPSEHPEASSLLKTSKGV